MVHRAHGVPLAEDMQAQESGACYCFPSVDAALEYCERAYLRVMLMALDVEGPGHQSMHV